MNTTRVKLEKHFTYTTNVDGFKFIVTVYDHYASFQLQRYGEVFNTWNVSKDVLKRYIFKYGLRIAVSRVFAGSFINDNKLHMITKVADCWGIKYEAIKAEFLNITIKLVSSNES